MAKSVELWPGIVPKEAIVVRNPLTPEQIEAGRRLGLLLRSARGESSLADTAHAAGISPETLRKIETGRLPSPAFGTIAALSTVLGVPLDELASAWSNRAGPPIATVSTVAARASRIYHRARG